MFAVKFIYLYNCCKEPEARKQPWKISESWCGVRRGGKQSLHWLQERSWHRKWSHMAQIYCVLGFPFKSHYSHGSEQATALSHSFRFWHPAEWLWLLQKRDWRGGNFITLRKECARSCTHKEGCRLSFSLNQALNTALFKGSRQGSLAKEERRREAGRDEMQRGSKGMGSLDGSKNYPGFSGWGCFLQWCKADFRLELTSTHISGHA